MRVNDLDNTILLEKNFRKIGKDLGRHMDKLEDDAKEVKMNVVQLLVNKANKMLDALDKAMGKDFKLANVDKMVEKATKQLNFLKGRFETFREKFKDNKFEKEIMDEVDKILEELILRIEGTLAGAEDAIQAKIKDIAKQASDEANAEDEEEKHGRKVPRGIAQDLKSRKTFVAGKTTKKK